MRLFRSMRSPNVFEACNHRRGNKLSCFVESCRNGCSPCVIEELYPRNNGPNWRGCSIQAKQRLFDCLVYGGCGGRVLNWSAPMSFGRSFQRFERGCEAGDLYWNGTHRYVAFSLTTAMHHGILVLDKIFAGGDATFMAKARAGMHNMIDRATS